MRKILLFIFIIIGFYAKSQEYDEIYIRNFISLNDSTVTNIATGDTLTTNEFVRILLSNAISNISENEIIVDSIRAKNDSIYLKSPATTGNVFRVLDSIYASYLYVIDTARFVNSMYVNNVLFDGTGLVSLGTYGQVPYVNTDGTDLIYSPNFTWNDTVLNAGISGNNLVIGDNVDDFVYGGLDAQGNTLVGENSFNSITTGSYNTILGSSSATSLTQGSENIIIGHGAGVSLTIESGNIIIGDKAAANETGSDKLYIENSNSASPLIYGNFLNDSLKFNGTVQILNNFIHNDTILSIKSAVGLYNLFIGDSAGIENNTGGNYNLFTGILSGNSNTTGDYNTFIGNYAGYSNTITSRNTFVGYGSGYSSTTGQENTFIGYETGYYNEDGNYNIIIGNRAGYNLGTGDYNTIAGYQSGYNNTGAWNSFYGYEAGYSNTDGAANLFAGYYSGRSNTTGDQNTFIGYEAGRNNETGSSNVFLGYRAGRDETGSNKLYINNTSGTPLIYGDFATDELTLNADTTHFAGHVEVDSNLYVYGRSILEKYEAAFYTDPDSTITTSATTDWSFLGGGANEKYTYTYIEGFAKDVDTLYFVQNANDLRDSVEFNVAFSGVTATSNVNKNVYYSVFIKSTGDANYRELRPVTKITRTISADVYYVGPSVTMYPIFLKDGDKLQIQVKVAASTSTVSTKHFSFYIKEQ